MKDALEPTAWAEHGLAGLVILALFLMLAFLLKLHAGERKEWRQDAGARQGKTDAVIGKLADAIRDAARDRRP